MHRGFLALLTGLTVVLIAVHSARAADLAETIASRPNLSMLAAALKASGIADKLKEKGPLTVFAPTNEAFKRLPPNTMANLTKPENKEQLVKLLTYHVVAARLVAKDMDGKMFKTKSVNGKELDVDADDGEGIKVNKGKLTQVDISADNGVIHEINRVLLP